MVEPFARGIRYSSDEDDDPYHRKTPFLWVLVGFGAAFFIVGAGCEWSFAHVKPALESTAAEAVHSIDAAELMNDHPHYR